MFNGALRKDTFLYKSSRVKCNSGQEIWFDVENIIHIVKPELQIRGWQYLLQLDASSKIWITEVKADIRDRCSRIELNPLRTELNPSAQRCLTRFFTGDFAYWTVHFGNICVKNQPMQQLFIQFINYVW
jgi:hypothetical protein